MIRVVKFLPRSIIGLTFFPFVLVKNHSLKSNNVLINHEHIHLRQQIELFIIFFYMLYFSEFLMRLLLFRNVNKAYKTISFEKEAYDNEGNLGYLKSRPFWNFINYF